MSVDYNRIATLLHIVDTANQWPTLKGIHDLAMAELVVANAVALEDKAKLDTQATKKAEAAKPVIEKVEPLTPTPAYNPAGQTNPARPV